MVAGMDLQQAFDLIAASLDGPAAVAVSPLTVNWYVTDQDTAVRIELSNGTMHSVPDRTYRTPDVMVRGDRAAIERIIAEGTTLDSLLDDGSLVAEGNVTGLRSLFDCITPFPRFYNIIEP